MLPGRALRASWSHWGTGNLLFGDCPVSVDHFTGADCTEPNGWSTIEGDGIRVEGNAAGAFQNWTFVRSRTTTAILTSGSGYSGDVWVTLVAVDSIQEVGLVASPGDAGNGYAVRADAAAGEIQLIRIDSLTATVLDTLGGITWADGDKIGIRYDYAATTISGYRKPAAGAWSAALVTAVDATYGPVIYGMLGESTPGGPAAISLADAFDLSSYGQTPAGTAALNPPFTCADGIDIYSWDNLAWEGLYYGGQANFATIVCPVWWLKITASAHGHYDCATHYAMGWNTSENVYAFGNDGTAYASPVYYANSTDEDAALDSIESSEGLYNFDHGFAHKEIDAIQSSIDSIQAAWAAEGAYIQTNTSGGKTSRALLMPVHPAVGLMDDFSIGGVCPQQIIRYR